MLYIIFIYDSFYDILNYYDNFKFHFSVYIKMEYLCDATIAYVFSRLFVWQREPCTVVRVQTFSRTNGIRKRDEDWIYILLIQSLLVYFH